jgi:Na+/phosphate symporter
LTISSTRELAAKKIKNPLKFSEEGAAELQAFHGPSGDVKIARQLVQEKLVVRQAERAASENHRSGFASNGLPASRQARCILTFFVS